MVGHVSLALIPGSAGVGLGLCAVGRGRGGLKANATTSSPSLSSTVDQRLDRTLFGWEMPVVWTDPINAIFIILLAGAFASCCSVDDEAVYFSVVGGAAVAFGVLLVLASPFIHKLMSGVR
ncbi:hypothetical protein [Lentzea sp. NEAU-D7]|uniref:hypothetical protein n=1 Tax=Lentzea sp. NEAU-D7 TaxID=2994667 RepID=UPI00224AD986|nr:hypothetical protein [Lentzea sp. NEAU-D7]MCX2948858.1 hypothetical protein [Lentzea sp. NEAU-D7]